MLRETLRETLAASHAPLRHAVAAYRTACTGLASDADLLDVLRAAGSIALAAEAIAAASKEAETAARTALANAMSETGCTSVALPNHTVHLSHKPAYVAVEDESAIPANLLRSWREQINADVPLQSKKPSIAAWLSTLRETLLACESRDEVEAVILSDDVCRACRTFQGIARQRLREITAEALARHPEV